MFELTSFMEIVPGRPGMLVPLLGARHTNMAYVQEMDEYYFVKSIVPYLDYELYGSVPCDVGIEVKIGGPGIVAFRLPDGQIFSGKMADVLSFLEKNDHRIGDNPILRMQLNRLAGIELLASRDVWIEVANSSFDSRAQRDLWVDTESQTFLRQKKIWEKIENSLPSLKKVSAPAPIDDFEELLRWLINRRYYLDDNWATYWHYIFSIMPLDERVRQTAAEWVYAVGQEDLEKDDVRSVVSVLVDIYKSGTPDNQFVDFLIDTFRASPEYLFAFLRPKATLRDMLALLVRSGEVQDLKPILNFYLDNVPKESDVVKELMSSLRAREKKSSYAKTPRGPLDQDSEWIVNVQKRLALWMRAEKASSAEAD